MKRYLAILLGLALFGLVAPSTLAGKGNGKPGGGGGGGGGSTPAGTIYFTLGSDLYAMDADGGNKNALTAGVHGQPSHDLHDGSRWFLDYRVVNGTYPDGRQRRELFAVRDSGAATQLTDQADLDLGFGLPNFNQVRWTPDDTEISFIARRWNTTTATVIEAGIYAAELNYNAGAIVGLVAQPTLPLVEADLVDMGGLRGLVPDIDTFDWSPDGDKIVHNTRLATGWIDLDLTVVTLGGGGATTLTTTASAHTPVWSPDGSLIAFGGGTIWTIRPDGTDQREVIRFRAGRKWTSYDLPRWSPTGSHLICTGSGSIDDDKPQDVYRVLADGSGKTNLTDDVDTRYLTGTPAVAVAWR
ncbi:MAG: TolB family protein [Planctomycetota bacterium]|jgi:Tol biopolymer transport system component